MKTKIIYISGNEVFEMAEIRAAFDEVRAALNLDNDTILFGVPVDKESALNVPVTDITHDAVLDAAPASDDITAAPEIEDVPVPEKKVKRPSRRAAAAEKETTTVEVVSAVAVEEPENPAEPEIETTNIEDAPEMVAEDVAPVIPILSVLGAKAIEAEPVPIMDDAEPETIETPIVDEEVVAPVEIDAISEIAATPTIEAIETVSVTAIDEPAVIEAEPVDDIDSKITDNTPAVSAEKTLEQLLESMTPLREDIAEEFQTTDDTVEDADASKETVEENPEPAIIDIDDSDATLAKLADEFAKTQDSLPMPNSGSRGRIGKLKTIIPFKRKQEDTGLMSDLFGWAGVAANDDEVSLPSFFANAKK